MAKPTLSPEAIRQIAEIARTVLSVETLEERKSDRLDFHTISV